MTRIISSPQRDILPLRSILPDGYFEHVSRNTAPIDLGFTEASRHVDSGTICQCHHRADTGSRYQAPAHFIIAHDGQQTTVQDDELLAKCPPDNKQ
ncbi:MAG TPA: hypothetical protein VGG11_03435 [Xanthobacteraceae bacterium]|jgi:hypothetical protein